MISAHGIGGPKDLPISLPLAIGGAGAAVAISFVVLIFAWRTPRYDGARSGRPVPALSFVDSTWWVVLWRVVGMVLFLYTAMVGIFGKDLLVNPIFGIFYVWWWVALVPASFLFGPVWRAISPPRTINWLIARLTGGDPDDGYFEYPPWLGHWPAALGLLAFAWMELVYPYNTNLGPVRLWCAVYVAAMLVGGALFGNRFFTLADPFEVYSTLVSKLSVWGRRDGVLVMRSPLANLDTVVVEPGLVAVVSVLFGTTVFDSFKDSTPWVSFFSKNDWVNNHAWAPQFLNNVCIVLLPVLVGLIFVVGTMATGVERGFDRRRLPGLYAHAVLPIIVAYVMAHYLSFLLEAGQGTLIKISDPFSNGANWFGTAHWKVDYFFSYHTHLLADIKVLLVVIGHVMGVVSSHDRALKLLPKRHQIVGQLPLLFAMIAFTVGGLYLLFAS